MSYDNIIYDDLVKEEIEQLNTAREQLLIILENIKNNQKFKDDIVLMNMNKKITDEISIIDNKINRIIYCMRKYTSEIDVLNNSIITNYSEANENIYVRKINEIIENDL